MIFIKQYKILLVIILNGLLFFSIIYFLIIPLQNRIVNKANAIQEKMIDQEINKRRIAQLPEFERQFNLIDLNQSRLNLFVNEGGVVDLLRQIEILAGITHNDIEIKIFDKEKTLSNQKIVKVLNDNEEANGQIQNSKSDEEKGDLPKTIASALHYDKYLEMEIKIWGNYNQLAEFIKKLNGLNYLFDIIKISVMKQEKDNLASFQSSAVLSVPNIQSASLPQQQNTEMQISEIITSKDLSSQVNIIFYLSN